MLKRLAAPALLVLLTIGVYWKILLSDQYTWLDAPDFTYQVAPWFQLQATEWHKGRFPLWDPYHVGGQSLIGQMQPGVVYPLNWLLFLAPLKDGFIQLVYLHWYFAIIHMMAALFAYAFCRDLGRSRMASILGGVVFAFGGYLGTVAWPQMLNGAVWAPLILMFSFRAFRGDSVLKNAALSGAFLGMAFLGGHHQAPTFMALAVAGLWIAEVVRRPRHAPAFLLLVAIAFCIAAPQTLPAYATGQDSLRWVGAKEAVKWNEKVPYSVHELFELSPISMLGIFIPYVYSNSDPYLGLTAFLLVVAGVAIGFKEREVKLLTALAVGGLLLALAGRTLFHGLLYALVPAVEKARNPSMATLVFCAAAAPLASYGFDLLDAVWRKRLAITAGTVAALGWTVIAAVRLLKLPLTVDLDRFSMACIVATALACVLGGIRARVLLLLLVLIDIGSLPGLNWTSKEQGWQYWSQLHRDDDIAWFLRQMPQPLRVDINDQDIAYNFGDWYGIETFGGGYFASLPIRMMQGALWDDRAREIFSVGYCVGKQPPKPGLREVFASRAGIKVWELPGARGRVWTEHIAGKHEICSGDEVKLVNSEPNRVRIEARMNCRGLVVLGDAYAPDWRARVDGKRSSVEAPFSLLRGVTVDRGHHIVELIYRPGSLYWGIGLAAAAIAALAALAVFR